MVFYFGPKPQKYRPIITADGGYGENNSRAIGPGGSEISAFRGDVPSRPALGNRLHDFYLQECQEVGNCRLTRAQIEDTHPRLRGLPEALIESGLASLEEDGSLYISGVKARVERLGQLQSNAEYGALGASSGGKGGRPRKTPIRGLSETPIRGLSETPIRGLSKTPIRGLSKTPIRGLSETPIRGLSETPISAQQSPLLTRQIFYDSGKLTPGNGQKTMLTENGGSSRRRRTSKLSWRLLNAKRKTPGSGNVAISKTPNAG